MGRSDVCRFRPFYSEVLYWSFVVTFHLTEDEA